MAQRRLSAAAGANQRKRFPGGYIEADLREHASAVFVGEGDVLKTDIAPNRPQRFRVRPILDLRLDIHDLTKTRKARHAEDIDLCKRRKALQRLNECGDIERKCHQQNWIHTAFIDQISAQCQHDEVKHRDEKLHAGVEKRHVFIEVILCVDKL
ncbi:hypothetical protein SDC9_113718 [bioreactor metagenome]|uniref:Uncharacterized protein n=1 Tax=bioreactor metagenome TaxID=1076179 RepID=A0A645BN62_9ZZZZ